MDVISLVLALKNKATLDNLATNLDEATIGQVLTAKGDGTAEFD